MSVPGYAYPAFDYSESEFLATTPDSVVAGAGDVAAGFLRTIVMRAEGGNAVFLREATCLTGTSAAVGNRVMALQLNTPDGLFSARYNSPASLPAGQNVTSQWSVGIATAYTAGSGAFSPAPQIVLPPGYVWVFLLLSPQLGDTISFANAFGLRIPTAQTVPSKPQPVPTPLLT